MYHIIHNMFKSLILDKYNNLYLIQNIAYFTYIYSILFNGIK